MYAARCWLIVRCLLFVFFFHQLRLFVVEFCFVFFFWPGTLESFSGCPDVHDFCFCSLFLSDKVVSLPFNSFSLDDDVGPSRQDVVALEVLLEIVQVDDSFSFGDVDRSRSPSRFLFFGASTAVAEVLRDAGDRPRLFFLLASRRPWSLLRRCSGASTAVAPFVGVALGCSSHRRSSRGCPLGCPESLVSWPAT